MRQSEKNQLPLTPTWSNHQHGKDLKAISRILDENSHLHALASSDLCGGKSKSRGRDGMTGEQAIRIALIQRINGFSYRELAFHLVDSSTFRIFARVAMDKKEFNPKTLQSNVKALSEETWEAINKALLKKAESEGVEKGRKTRTDCTTVESNIHDPSDSSLLWDCVRVVTRLITTAMELLPELDWSFFHDHRRRAKRRTFEIQFPRKKKDKVAQRFHAYVDLLKTADQVFGYGFDALALLESAQPGDLISAMQLQGLTSELKEVIDSMEQVLQQTRRRILDEEKVPAQEKLVSIFEKHTDIIVKDNRETVFGHKICLTGGASSMILDCVVEDGNPADSSLVERTIKRQKDIYSRPPRQASFDGGFASKDNLSKAKELGVKDVVFHKKRGMEISDMAKSKWVFRMLRNFRAGIEGCISTLKRVFGLDRCNWRGHKGFKKYVWASVVSFNAVVLARHLAA